MIADQITLISQRFLDIFGVLVISSSLVRTKVFKIFFFLQSSGVQVSTRQCTMYGWGFEHFHKCHEVHHVQRSIRWWLSPWTVAEVVWQLFWSIYSCWTSICVCGKCCYDFFLYIIAPLDTINNWTVFGSKDHTNLKSSAFFLY